VKVSKQDADLFFDLMWALQFFVNQKLEILEDVSSLEDYIACSTDRKMEVRNALYDNKKLIDLFVEENPRNFSEEMLSIVSGWKNFVAGEFHIERYLKKYAVFIRETDVYGVLSLHQEFEDMVPRSRLPLYVRAVLLPFQGKIVYDGLFENYNIFFGGGIKRSLKEVYMRAKQNHRIIESFDAAPVKRRKKQPKEPLKDWTPELTELAAMAKKLRGSTGHPAIYSPAFSLVKASIAFAEQAVSDSADLDSLYTSLKKVHRALKRSITVLDREE
jgi:hypothetical protein